MKYFTLCEICGKPIDYKESDIQKIKDFTKLKKLIDGKHIYCPYCGSKKYLDEKNAHIIMGELS